MDTFFKQKLLGLRHPEPPRTFREALLGSTYWGATHETSKKTEGLAIHKKETYSEKNQVIESLERFAHEKVEKEGSQILKVNGGEIVVKDTPDWSNIQSKTSDQLKNVLKLDSKYAEMILTSKVQGEVKVLFVTEKFRSWDEASAELKSGFINELIVAFPLKTAELFERMIAAMKLGPQEVMIFPVEGMDAQDFSEDVMTVAASFRPLVIVTLGAKATSKILKSNDRLSLVHGQFFTRKLSEGQTSQIVPLFHPSIIETNQNMKKTAWTDMQKIMKFLKKLP